jgi:DNA-binding LytR/AlgR family response regulator
VALRLVLVDDEPLSRRALRQLLDQQADVTVVAECASSAEARAWMDDADAMMLDIEMPGLSGLDLARERRTQALPAIVFVTAFDRYAVPAFATEAVDYLCKPVTAERLDLALTRIRAHVVQHVAQHRAQHAAAGPPPAPDRVRGHVVVRTGRTEELISYGAIDCLEADDVYAAVYTGGRRLLVRQSLALLAESLPAPAFQRVHRSWIVQRAAVRALRQTTDGLQLQLRDGRIVPVSRRNSAAVRAWLRTGAP